MINFACQLAHRLRCLSVFGTLVLCMCQTAFAKELPITILLSSNESAYRQVAGYLQEHHLNHEDLTVVKATNEYQSSGQESLIIAVGTYALSVALSKTSDIPILATFIPRRSFEQLTSARGDRLQKIAAIYVDQPMDRQVKLIRTLLPKANTISTLFGDSSVKEQVHLERAALRFGLSVQSARLSSEDNPVNTINPLIMSSDLFLAIPDQGAFNRATAKWSLYLSLKHKKPLIGFSEKFVEAGALAAVFSTPDHIARQTHEWLSLFLNQEPLFNQAFPRYFDVKVNLSTARSINIFTPSDAKIKAALEEVSL
jgi:putative ABC transport system substrate-binding protein